MSGPWDEFIDSEKVLALHAKAIGGSPLKASEDCVDGRLGNAYSAEGYHNDEASPSDSLQGLAFAAFALYYLAKDHCFPDGNKRIAWLVAMEILLQRGLTVQASEVEAEVMIQGVIGNSLSGPAVVAWLAERLVAVPG